MMMMMVIIVIIAVIRENRKKLGKIEENLIEIRQNGKLREIKKSRKIVREIEQNQGNL